MFRPSQCFFLRFLWNKVRQYSKLYHNLPNQNVFFAASPFSGKPIYWTCLFLTCWSGSMTCGRFPSFVSQSWWWFLDFFQPLISQMCWSFWPFSLKNCFWTFLKMHMAYDSCLDGDARSSQNDIVRLSGWKPTLFNGPKNRFPARFPTGLIETTIDKKCETSLPLIYVADSAPLRWYFDGSSYNGNHNLRRKRIVFFGDAVQ